MEIGTAGSGDHTARLWDLKDPEGRTACCAVRGVGRVPSPSPSGPLARRPRMPRSIQGFKPKALSQDHRFYSDDDIEAIIAAAGGTVRGRVAGLRRRQALSERLEVVAHNYTQCSQFQTEPTAKQIADAMADIEAAAAKLIAALYVPEAMDEDPIASMPASLRYGALQAQAALEAGHGPPKRSGTGLLRDSVHGVYRLHRWAETAKRRWAETYKRDSNQPDRPHAQSDMSAMKNWIVYLEVWPVSGRVYSSAGSQHP